MRTTIGFVLVALAATSCRSSHRSSPPTSQPAASSRVSTAASRPAAAASPARLQALLARLATLPSETHAPDPSVPAPRAGRSGGAPELRGRDGGETVAFTLARTSVLADVTGNVARVEVTQLYQNPSNKRLEAVYAFPLPENAAVTDMMFRIGRRVVLSEVRKRAEAHAVYEKAKAEGHTAALTDQERPNLFTQSVANIPPGESVEVVLRYVHEVPFADGRYRFVFPTTIGPRYLPAGTPAADVARLSPPVIAPGLHAAHRVEIAVALHPGAAFADLGSRSHAIVSARDGDATLVALADGDMRADQDFVLAYRPAGHEPDARIVTGRDHDDDYLMLFVQPPVDVAPAMVRPKQMVFLIDKSGSMSGFPLDVARGVVRAALHKLGPDDTFQLVAFDSSTQAMSAAALPNTPDNVRAGEAWLDTLSGGGGTEMLGGIQRALDLPTDPRRLRMVVFLTDGFIGNEREIIDYIERGRGEARVFGFGIGSSVNRYLIEGIASAGRGASEYVKDGDPIGDAVARLYGRLDRPLLTDVSLDFGGLRVRDLEPRRLPDLFAGQPLVVVGRYGKTSGPTQVTLRGRLGTQPFVRTIDVTPAAQADPVLGTLWARRRIGELTDGAPSGDPRDVEGEVVALALRWKLLTQYTSFVAVERQLRVDTRVPLVELTVPNELPAGVSYDGIFGDAFDTSAEITPARVKPGDPEIRVRAPAGAQVRVQLPWETRPIAATWDARAGEFVARFLVPAGWPDGTFVGRVLITHGRGVREERTVELHVDTQPASLALVTAPDTARPGDTLLFGFKPALPVDTLLRALGSGAPGDLLRSATDVKEVLVRAPWGELARARMDGPLGIYTAALHVPATLGGTSFDLDVVASDTAGNVSRRSVHVALRPLSPRRYADLWTLVLLALVAAGGLGVGRVWGRA